MRRSRARRGTPSESTRTIPEHVKTVCQLYKEVTVVAIFVNQIKVRKIIQIKENIIRIATLPY